MSMEAELDSYGVQAWLDKLKNKTYATGCFFILNETVYPYFWGNGDDAVELEEAWDVICSSWLNNVYKTILPLQNVYPYILKGYINDEGLVIFGNDCPYYLTEIRFCFNLPSDGGYKVDSSLGIKLDISNDLAYVLKSMIKDCPYFERLPLRLKFRKKDYGSEQERLKVCNELFSATAKMVSEKRSRLGSLPKLAVG